MLADFVVICSDNKEVTHTADLIIGCDGAYSNIRQEMIKTTRTDFAQTYIPHGYVEICMPAVKTEVCMLSLLLYLRISLSDLTVLRVAVVASTINCHYRHIQDRLIFLKIQLCACLNHTFIIIIIGVNELSIV